MTERRCWVIFPHWDHCFMFSSVLWHCWSGDSYGIRPTVPLILRDSLPKQVEE